MRIAIVLNASWNIVNFRLGLLNALAMDGHSILAIAPKDSYSERIPFEFHDLPMQADGTNPIREIALLWRMIRLFKQTRPDVILLFTPKPNIYGSLAAQFCGIPSISNVAGLGSMFNRHGVVQWFFLNLYRLSLKKNLKVFFQNNEDLKSFVEKGLVDPHKAIRLPGSGIDLVRYKPMTAPQRRTETRFLLVARLLWEKGVGDFAEVARQARAQGIPAKFQIVGFLDAKNPSAVSREQMESWVAEGILEYLGPRDDVWEVIGQSDCFLFPSFYREGVPRVLLEAAAMGKPIIAYENIGTGDVVEHERTGILVPSRDVKGLVAACRKLCAMSEEEKQKMGLLGRAKMEREFDESLVVKQYRSVISTIPFPRTLH